MERLFVGRKKELSALQRAYESDKSEFFPIYGRRRVGKSELILHFGKNRPFIYYLGKNAPETLQIKEFLGESARALKEPLLASMAISGWKDALEAVVGRWKGPGKLVLALDEYQWISSASPSLSSVLQELWDRKWSKSGSVVLVLCGSYMGFMEREVLGNKSPLFGRRTGQILLRSFDHKESTLFHPGYSRLDQARTYFICGGIPLYHRFFSSKRSVENNIAVNFLDEFAPLFREAAFLLGEELRELDSYYGILLALASGSSAIAEIAKVGGLPERSLHYYLTHLVNLGYVRRRFPLSEGKPSLRNVRYCLHDPLLRFWFRFIYPNESTIMRMGPNRSFIECIKPEFDSYCGGCFEVLCREALPYLYSENSFTPDIEIGEYWSAETQIDIVGYRKDGWTDLGECKWGRVRSMEKVHSDLQAKAGLYPNRRNATIGKIVFTRDTVSTGLRKDGFVYYSLEDIYG